MKNEIAVQVTSNRYNALVAEWAKCKDTSELAGENSYDHFVRYLRNLGVGHHYWDPVTQSYCFQFEQAQTATWFLLEYA